MLSLLPSEPLHTYFVSSKLSFFNSYYCPRLYPRGHFPSLALDGGCPSHSPSAQDAAGNTYSRGVCVWGGAREEGKLMEYESKNQKRKVFRCL